MKLTLLLLGAGAAVMAQTLDTVSATASGACEPHNDHWHCPAGVPEPTAPPALSASRASVTPSSTQSHSDDEEHDHDHAVSASACEPHGDHWHCPSGVAQPSTQPAALSTCSPHGDHWHCPSGVAEPSTPPVASATTTRASGSAAAAASGSPTASQTPGAAAKIGAGALAIMGAVGAWVL